MPAVLPHRFLFRYSLPVCRRNRLPKKGRKLLDLPAQCALPDFCELDDARPFGTLRAAWNVGGIGFSVAVTGKKHPPVASVDSAVESDGLQIWIDTRNTQSIHRASRFCHHFCLLPAGSGRNARNPVAVQLPIARAREEQVLADASQVTLRLEALQSGYRLEAWLPADVLTGYDPEANPRLGFYYYLRDSELGEQYLTVGPEFPFAHDPSLWSTLELTG